MPKNTTTSRPAPTSPPDNRSSLRRQRAAAARATARRTVVVRASLAAVGLAVVAAIIVGVAFVVSPKPAAGPGTTVAAAAPAAADASGAIILGEPDAKVTVTIYSDFMCSYCGLFERANGAQLASDVASGTVKLAAYPLTFLNDASLGTRYSTRAANAFATIADTDPVAALAFYQALYANQPAENTDGLTDAQLAGYAATSGATQAVVDRIAESRFASWADQTTSYWYPDRISGTPTILVNGTKFDGDPYHAGPFEAAIAAAQG